jgi:hypothetical protein
MTVIITIIIVLKREVVMCLQKLTKVKNIKTYQTYCSANSAVIWGFKDRHTDIIKLYVVVYLDMSAVFGSRYIVMLTTEHSKLLVFDDKELFP